MRITEEIEVSNGVFAPGGFADIKTGTYMGHQVAVKTLRFALTDDFLKKREVNVNKFSWLLGMRFWPSFPRNFAKKLSFGICCLIRTS